MSVSSYLDRLISLNNFVEMEQLSTQFHKGTALTDLLIANLKIPSDYSASGYIHRIEILKAKLTLFKMTHTPLPRLMKSCEKTAVDLETLVANLKQTRADFQPLSIYIYIERIVVF